MPPFLYILAQSRGLGPLESTRKDAATVQSRAAMPSVGKRKKEPGSNARFSFEHNAVNSYAVGQRMLYPFIGSVAETLAAMTIQYHLFNGYGRSPGKPDGLNPGISSTGVQKPNRSANRAGHATGN
jgi:hypothetical protein